ncbi:NAD-dependent epimerase/dehydratase family protein [candidate division WOR-3 bacterium]|nr:NAD-dependent epimerase/dehydratase family protein [candidate division WOR-3 bacterium]
MRIIITGGAGFIGSHLVDHYVAQGVDVVIIDNLITGRESNIEHSVSKVHCTLVREDVCRVRRLDGPVDYILHFACPASPFDYQKYPIETLHVMSFGTDNMLALAREKQAVFLLASTSEVYGDPIVHPQTEEYTGNVNVLSTRAVYDEGKRFAEALTLAYHRVYGIKVRIVRIFNTYGERMREGDGRVIPAMITAALRNEPLPIFGKGQQTRSFCYISDMVRAITRMVDLDYSLPVNLGNPVEYTILELAEVIKRLCDSRSGYSYFPLPESDPKKRRPDIQKAQELLKWQPEISLEQGIKQVIEWFRRKQ